LHQAQEVTAELVGVETYSEILDTQVSAAINNGRKKRVVYITICGFRSKYAVMARHLSNSIGGQ
jgi:hypothetical protein